MDRVKRIVAHPWVVRGAQLFIGAWFVWAGLAKISDPAGFATNVHNFRLVPVPLENLVALTLPWVELVAGLALVLGLRARAGGLVSLALMVVFTLAVGIALARGLDIECGCTGTDDGARVGLLKLLQNLGGTALALVATMRPPGGAAVAVPAALERSPAAARRTSARATSARP